MAEPNLVHLSNGHRLCAACVELRKAGVPHPLARASHRIESPDTTSLVSGATSPVDNPPVGDVATTGGAD